MDPFTLSMLASSAMSGIGGIMGMFNGSPASNVQLPQQWQMPGMNDAAGGAMSGIQQLLGMNVPQQLMPAYSQVAGQLMNNPGAQGAMSGSNTASNYGMGAAGNAMGTGDYLSQMGRGITPYAMGVMNAGFDPQNALYGREAFKTQQSARAGNAARGLDTTPYGAGVENDAMRNFNIDWQNNLLQRMTSGLGAGTSAMGAGGNLMNMGAQTMAQAPGLAQQAGMFPYQTFNQIGGDRLAALNQLSQAGLTATQVPQQGVSNYLNYLGTGSNANSIANQTAGLGLQQANMGFQQNQQIGNQIGQSLAGIGRYWPGAGGTGWGSGGGAGGGSMGWGGTAGGTGGGLGGLY